MFLGKGHDKRSQCSEGSFACHIYCETGHLFMMAMTENVWHSQLLPNVWQWRCHCQRLRSVAVGIRTSILSLAGRMLQPTARPPRYTNFKSFLLQKYAILATAPLPSSICYQLHNTLLWNGMKYNCSFDQVWCISLINTCHRCKYLLLWYPDDNIWTSTVFLFTTSGLLLHIQFEISMINWKKKLCLCFLFLDHITIYWSFGKNCR